MANFGAMRSSIESGTRDLYQQLVEYAALAGWGPLQCNVVYEGDDWSLTFSQNGAEYRHTPNNKSDQPVLAYCCSRFKDGTTRLETMSAEDIVNAEGQSKAKGPRSPWKLWRGEMIKKSVFLRWCKRSALTSEVAEIVQKIYDIDGADFSNEKPAPKATRRNPREFDLSADGPGDEDDIGPLIHDHPAWSVLRENEKGREWFCETLGVELTEFPPKVKTCRENVGERGHELLNKIWEKHGA